MYVDENEFSLVGPGGPRRLVCSFGDRPLIRLYYDQLFLLTTSCLAHTMCMYRTRTPLCCMIAAVSSFEDGESSQHLFLIYRASPLPIYQRPCQFALLSFFD